MIALAVRCLHALQFRTVNLGERAQMRSFLEQLAVACLVAAGLASNGCGQGDGGADTATQQMQATMTKAAAAGAAASATLAPGDQLGASAAAPQGDCPEGLACTRVLFPENERVCMKPGEMFAPACTADDKCPDVPKAEC